MLSFVLIKTPLFPRSSAILRVRSKEFQGMLLLGWEEGAWSSPSSDHSTFLLRPFSVTLPRGVKEAHTAWSSLLHLLFCLPSQPHWLSGKRWLHRKCNSKYRNICKTYMYSKLCCSVQMLKPAWRTNGKCTQGF